MPQVPDALRRAAPSLLVCLLAFCWFQYVTWTFHASHRTFTADVGVFHVLASGPWFGNWLETPLAPDAAGNYFGIHFSPALLLITPFYGFSGSAMVVLTAFNVGLAVGGVFFARVAAHVLQNEWLGAAFALLYFSNHFVLSMHLAMHPESLAMAGIMAAFYGAVREDRRWFFAGLVAALLVKEDYAIFLGIFCAALATEKSMRSMALRGIVLCVVWGLAAAAIMWWCGYAEYAALGMTPASRFGSHEDGLLPFLGRAIWRVATNPTPLLLIVSVTPPCLRDWRLSLAGLLGALPFLLTDDAVISRLHYYYCYGAIPFFLMAAVRGAAALRLAPRLLAVLIAITAILSSYLPTRTDDLPHRPRPIAERHIVFQEFIKLIPPDASVGAQYGLLPQIPARKVLLPIQEWSIDRLDYIVMDRHGTTLNYTEREYRTLSEIIYSPQFEPVLDLEGFKLFRRISPP